MGKSGTIERATIKLIKKYPNKTASELYKLLPFDTEYSYFSTKYNEYKNKQFPSTKDGLYAEYPKAVLWILENYSETSLTIKDISELLKIPKRAVRIIKKEYKIVKKSSRRNKSNYKNVTKKSKNTSLKLQVGDTIRVTKYHPTHLRDIVHLGRWEVVHKNRYCISFKDAKGLVHGFHPILINDYLEFEKVTN